MKLEEAFAKWGRSCPHCGGEILSRHGFWYCEACKQVGSVYKYIADKTGMGYFQAFKKYGEPEEIARAIEDYKRFESLSQEERFAELAQDIRKIGLPPAEEEDCLRILQKLKEEDAL